MNQFFTIARIDLGSSEVLVTSDAPVTLLKDDLEVSFSVPSLGITVPARSVDMIGTSASSGSATISLSTQTFDAIGHLASGGSIIRKEVEIRLAYDESNYEDCYLAYRGVVSSFDINVDEGSVNLNVGPDFVSVDKSFPESTVGDEGRFPDAPEGTKSRAVPVVYGHVKKMPVPIVGYFGESARLAIASHNVFGSLKKPGMVQIGTTPSGDLVDYYRVQTGNDDLGGYYSFIEIPKSIWDDSVYIVEMEGKTSSNGNAISRLGDMLNDLWSTYAGGSLRTLDSARISKSTNFLNSIRVGVAITESVSGQSVIDIVAGRFRNLPVRLCYDRGLFAWESVSWPSSNHGDGSFRFGIDSVQRSSMTITSLDQVRNRFRFKMSFDAKFNESSETRLVDQSNNPSLRTSVSLFGETPLEEIDLSDATDKLGAGIAIESIVRSRSNPRITVTYAGCDADFLREPLGKSWFITDKDAGLNSSSFVLVAVTPEVSSGTVSLTFISVDDVNTTLRKSRQASEVIVSSQQSSGGEGGGQLEQPYQENRYGVFLKCMNGPDTTSSEFKAATYLGFRTPHTNFTNSNDLSTREGYEIILRNTESSWLVLDPHPTATHPYAQRQYLSTARIPFEFTSNTLVKGNKDHIIPGLEVFPLDENFSRYPSSSTKFQVMAFMRVGQTIQAIINSSAKNPTHTVDLGSNNYIGYGTLSLTGRSGTFYHYPRTIDGVQNQIRYFDKGHNIIWRNTPDLWTATALPGIHHQFFGMWSNTFESRDSDLNSRCMLVTDIDYFSDTTGRTSRSLQSLTDSDVWKNDFYGLDYGSMTSQELDSKVNLGSAGIGANLGSQTSAAAVSGSTYTGPISYYDSMGVRGFITNRTLSRLGTNIQKFKGTDPYPTRSLKLQILKFPSTTFVNDRFNYPQHWDYIGAPFAQNNIKFIVQNSDTDKPYYVIGKLEDSSSTTEKYWLFVTKIGHDLEVDGSYSMEIRNPNGTNPHTITPTSTLSGYHLAGHVTSFTMTKYNAIVDGTTILTDSNSNKWLVQQKNSTVTNSSNNTFHYNHVFVTPVNHANEPGTFSWT